MTKKINVKDKLLDDTLDLSCCDLKEVPVKEISVLRRASIVDLSNNDLMYLPINFVSLTQIIKLDLSKNNLTELPENFGDMVQLRHLDLYSNQISRLPLSLAKLKNLRWLDLKENPLTSAVASIAGPCTNAADCQACAKNVVNYLTKVKAQLDEAKRNNEENEQETPVAAPKKESQKKKKKKADKEKSNSSNNENKQQSSEKPNKSNKNKNKKQQNDNQSGLILPMFRFFSILLKLMFIAVIIIPFLPNAEEIEDYLKEKTGLPIRRFKIDVQVPTLLKQRTELVLNVTRSFFANFYGKYFEQNSVGAFKET